ncbi:three-Cys-motif partner protein TcmP [Rhodococcoides yunnanense]|uniref:three-Cys-motif partner protein TcmP n=1 Tax=Rhodococcoides yunnanense TaxID=278209 RepID=UPI0009338319|nr:three-Cys-motif partner protein TcmP [Rhodococcus yunnanensis]
MSERTPREWSYWTVNKLQILSDYLPAFNKAAKRSDERLYIDLMAGQAANVERYTGKQLAGSPRRALESDPGFTHHAFCELPKNAGALEDNLRRTYPHKTFDVVPGDCNSTIDSVLRRLKPVSWAPTFVFADQQAAEIHWSTIEKVSRFKPTTSRTKAEIWMLVSPAMVIKGATGSGHVRFRERVSMSYGTEDWLRIQRARDRKTISGSEYRREMVNLIRKQLSEDLGYAVTHSIPMTMQNETELYYMVFATDHIAGDNIMSYLYNKAAQREPGMMKQARQLAAEETRIESGQLSFLDVEIPDPEVSGETLWRPEPHWEPSSRPWW